MIDKDRVVNRYVGVGGLSQMIHLERYRIRSALLPMLIDVVTCVRREETSAKMTEEIKGREGIVCSIVKQRARTTAKLKGVSCHNSDL